MGTLHVTLVAAFLSTSSAYAQADANWTAGIGNGHTSQSTPLAAAVRSAPGRSVGDPSSASSRVHWTARIGTGHVSEATSGLYSPVALRSQMPSAASVPSGPDWTSRIGTGHASQSDSGMASPKAALSRNPANAALDVQSSLSR